MTVSARRTIALFAGITLPHMACVASILLPILSLGSRFGDLGWISDVFVLEWHRYPHILLDTMSETSTKASVGSDTRFHSYPSASRITCGESWVWMFNRSIAELPVVVDYESSRAALLLPSTFLLRNRAV